MENVAMKAKISVKNTYIMCVVKNCQTCQRFPVLFYTYPCYDTSCNKKEIITKYICNN